MCLYAVRFDELHRLMTFDVYLCFSFPPRMEGSKARLGEVALRFLGLCEYLRSHLQAWLKGPWIWMRVLFVCEFRLSPVPCFPKSDSHPLLPRNRYGRETAKELRQIRCIGRSRTNVHKVTPHAPKPQLSGQM